MNILMVMVVRGIGSNVLDFVLNVMFNLQDSTMFTARRPHHVTYKSV